MTGLAGPRVEQVDTARTGSPAPQRQHHRDGLRRAVILFTPRRDPGPGVIPIHRRATICLHASTRPSLARRSHPVTAAVLSYS